MNLRSLNSSSMQGASFDREIASGFARKAISQDGEAVGQIQVRWPWMMPR